jgi:transposase
MTKEVPYKELLPNLKDLTLRNVVQTNAGWEVEAEGSGAGAACSLCGVDSCSRHSYYWRQLRDLPLQGTSVIIKVRLGRWRCRNPECARRIFTQRVAGLLVPHAQQTNRLSDIQILVARALGGRPGERLLSRLGMPTDRHTLLRQVTKAALAATLPEAIRVVGVNDWAWSKGQSSFGTILVDLERGEVVDLLPVRSADTLSHWLAKHPEVTVVSRDRQGLYAEGARRGAPEAVQVADRFHLVLNLRQAVERELAVQRQHLRLPLAPLSEIVLKPMPEGEIRMSKGRPIKVSSMAWNQQAETIRQRRQEKLELFQTIQRMKAAGLKSVRIAKHLGINRRRIDKWLRLDTLPERNRMHPRPGMAESFLEYLRQRWDAGYRHGRTLFAEIRELGYIGGFTALAKFLSPWRQPPLVTATVAPEVTPMEDFMELKETTWPASRQISPQVAAALSTKPRPDLTPLQAEIVDTLKTQCPGFAVMRKLVLSFSAILQVGKLDTLHQWMEQAQETGIHALKRFVQTLKQDLKAVEAAVTEPWSNGPVEGHINRLKTIKRQMYGRAGVSLLRARLLPEGAFSARNLHQP